MTSSCDNCNYSSLEDDPAAGLSQVAEEKILGMAQRIIEQRFVRSHYLTSPDLTRQYLTMALAKEPRELFGLILLDTQHGVLGLEILFQGTIDGASVYPREIVKTVLQVNAAAVILVHNHPSGHAEPSRDDRRITERLVSALTTIDVRTLDHLIVAGPEVVSFAERGLMP